jgi:pseudoazurin
MRFRSIALGLALACAAAPTLAANVDVQMLNKGDEGAFVFEPALVQVAVGDTVTFVPTDKGHNADAPAAGIPEGATPFKTALSQEAVETFTVPGVYLIKCDPHYALGMVAIVVVGDDLSNLDAVKAIKSPKKAQERLEEIYEELEQQ